MPITLVRHTTPDVAKGTCYGRTDLGLAQSFAQEADLVRRTLPEVSVIVSSPLTRCRRLAERVKPQAEHEVSYLDNWMEMDFGSWEGIAWSDIPRASLDAWAADFTGYAGHGGESVAMLERRVRTALKQTPDGAIVVTHSGCIRAACAIYGIASGWDTETEFGGSVTLP